MSLLLNRCQFTTATTGTGTITVGSATSKFQTPASADAVNGGVYSYAIEDGTAWEVGTGTYSTTGPTLTRTLIQSSTGSLLSLSGSATVTISPNVADFATPDLSGTPSAPPSGIVRLGESPLAGIDWPSFRSAQAPERFVQPLFGRTKFYGFQGYQGFLAYTNMNGATISSSTLSGATLGNTSYYTRQMRANMTSAATTGSIVSIYPNASRNLFVGDGSGRGGFACVLRYGFADTVSGARAFSGLTGSGAAPTNVNPSTLTNVIGLAQVDGSNNLNIVYGGSSAQTPINLGVNFPANTATTDFYELWLFSDPNDNSQVRYLVNRWSGATAAISNTASGTLSNSSPGVTLPATTTSLGPTFWRTNNATASAVQLEVGSFFCWSE